MLFEPVIGLEVHVQLRTRSKIFCRCANEFGAAPNTHVCPVCLGHPGTLPVLNRAAVDLALRLALSLGCRINRRSIFARKNYFYADLPKGYQISQYLEPIAEGGRLPLSASDREIRIHRIHLEEDAGKLLHEIPGGGALPGKSLVDFNRCGVPLVEVVSEPELRTPREAQDYLQTLRQVLLYTDTSDGNLEEGSLRCDANVSVRPQGEEQLGTKTEIKNLNSFRHVAKAIEYEIERQVLVIESGGEIHQETRSFDAAAGVTRSMRSKEEAHDYRYFPEPDLPPLVVDEERLRRQSDSLPELPWDLRARLEADFGLRPEDAALLSAEHDVARYFLSAVSHDGAVPRVIANLVMSEMLRLKKSLEGQLEDLVTPSDLARIARLQDSGEISATAAKEVLAGVADSKESPDAVVDRLGVRQVRDAQQTRQWVEAAIAENVKAVSEFQAGRQQAFGYLVGRVMKISQGQAEPRQVQALLREVLSAAEVSPEA